MRTVALIQARMSSTRLPGKVLEDLAGKCMLLRVVERVGKFRGVDETVVATSALAADDPIAKLCADAGIPVFRGHPTDVLNRFLAAATALKADVCVRITSDCPLIDPDVSSEIIRRFQSATPPIDYASNKIPQSFPRGLDTEVFTTGALRRAAAHATQDYERSHVTIYMYEHPDDFRLLSVTSTVDRADWRWTVDTADDLEFVRRIYEKLGRAGNFGWNDVVELLEREPQLSEINRHVPQKFPRDERLPDC